MAPSLCFHTTAAPPGVAVLRIEMLEPSLAVTPLRSLANFFEALQAACDGLKQRPDIVGCVLLVNLTVPHDGQRSSDLTSLVEGVSHNDQSEREESAATVRSQQAVARGLAQLAVPIVAGVAGPCHGPWAELASWCDRRLIADDDESHVGFPTVRRGEIPRLGGTARIPRLIAWSRAVDWLASGDLLDAAALVESGWAARQVPPARLVDECVALTRQLAEDRTWKAERQSLQGPLLDGAPEG